MDVLCVLRLARMHAVRTRVCGHVGVLYVRNVKATP